MLLVWFPVLFRGIIMAYFYCVLGENRSILMIFAWENRKVLQNI